MGSPAKTDLNALVNKEGGKTELSYKSPEDPEDKALRLHKDKMNFYVKELAPTILAGTLVVTLFVYCLVVLGNSKSLPGDRDQAWKLVSVIIVGVVGTIFGRATAK